MSNEKDTGSQKGESRSVRRSNAQIECAARWLSTMEPLRPLVPHLRKTFGLSAADAIQAIRRANALRGLP